MISLVANAGPGSGFICPERKGFGSLDEIMEVVTFPPKGDASEKIYIYIYIYGFVQR